MKIKTRELSKKAIEHLLLIGYVSDENVDVLHNSPYLLIDEYKRIYSCNTVNEYKKFEAQELKENQILKLQKEIKNPQKPSKKEKAVLRFVKKLNSKKYSKIAGYDVSWAYQKSERSWTDFEILPITNTACGSIAKEYLPLICQFADENEHLYISISYTNYNKENEKYGTYTPCVSVS